MDNNSFGCVGYRHEDDYQVVKTMQRVAVLNQTNCSTYLLCFRSEYIGRFGPKSQMGGDPSNVSVTNDATSQENP